MKQYSWDDESKEKLAKLWRQGRTATQIAVDLGGGLTRNAVIGKVHRMLLHKQARAKPTPGNVSQPSPKTASTNPPAAPEASVPVPATKPVASYGEPLALLALRDNHCRWPLSDPARQDFRFCAAYTTKRPYCAAHARMAYRPSTERRSADRALRIS